MKKSIMLILFITILGFNNAEVSAQEFAHCDGCTYQQKENIAMELVRFSGIAMIYDEDNSSAHKYFVTENVEPGFNFEYAEAMSLNTTDEKFIASLQKFYASTPKSARNSVTVYRNASDFGTRFGDMTAYDIYNTGKDRNDLTDAIDAGLQDQFGEDEVAFNIIKLIADAAASAINEGFGFRIVITFNDGSKIVIEISTDTGGNAIHDGDSNSNRDANNNPILHNENGSGAYEFTTQEQYEDFLRSAFINGISVGGSGGGGGGNWYVICSVDQGGLVCVLHK